MSTIFDVKHGEIPIKYFEGVTVEGFWDDAKIVLTNASIIAFPPKGGVASYRALENPDTYCMRIELEDIENVSLKKSFFLYSLELVFKNDTFLRFKSGPLDEIAEAIKGILPNCSSLIRFPSEERILFKSSYGIQFLPNLDLTFREVHFWGAYNINLVITTQRLFFYRINQLEKTEESLLSGAVTVQYGRPKLQFVSLPMDYLTKVKISKNFLEIVIKKKLFGDELPFLNVPPIDEISFTQDEYVCEVCSSHIYGRESCNKDEEFFKYGGFECGCRKFICSKCAKLPFFSKKMRCPSCGKKREPLYFLNESKYQVSFGGSTADMLEEYFISRIRAQDRLDTAGRRFFESLYKARPLTFERRAPLIGVQDKEWDLVICDKKYKDKIVPALQQALPNIIVEERQGA